MSLIQMLERISRHYENMFVQYTVIFHDSKNENLKIKK